MKARPATQRERALERENQELRAIIEGLAGGGQVSIIHVAGDGERAFTLGYRKGHEAALAGGREHFLNVELPTTRALLALVEALAGASTLAAFAGTPRADVRDLLRPFALRSADTLRARYQALEELLAKADEAYLDSVGQEIIRFHEALRAFGLGRDDGEALAACEAIRLTIAGELWGALAALRMGGRPPSDARAWIGQRLTEALRRQPDLRIPEAAGQLYGELLERERTGELLEIEEQALAELDARAGEEFRRSRRLTPGIKAYCKRAVRDWKETNLVPNS